MAKRKSEKSVAQELAQIVSPNLKSKVVMVTPKKAEEWLAKNGVNRPLSDSRVARYAEEMKKGNWHCNGEPIIFTEDYTRLLEGQHRLSAVILSGCTVPMYVTVGVPEEAFITLGSGASRTAADWFKIKGEPHYSHLAATLTRIWFYEQSGGASMHNSGSNAVPSKTDLDDLLGKFPKIRDSVEFCLKAENNTAGLALPSTLLSACHFVFAKKFGREKADDFVTRLATGENMARNHPIMLLRKRLMSRKNTKFQKESLQVVTYMVFRIFNAFVNNEPLDKLQLPRGEFTLSLKAEKAEKAG
jgi:hypothetical protein